MATITASAADSTAPSPAATDSILFDSRTSLQQVTTLSAALALWGPSGTTVSGLGFTTNFDSSGTHAFVMSWPADYYRRCTTATRTLPKRFAAPLPKEMYLQWKQHMGRTATGGGAGAIGSFTVANPACTNAGRSNIVRLLRAASQTDSAHPVDLMWKGVSPTASFIRVEKTGLSMGENESWSYNPQASVGTDVTYTLYVKTESALGAHDGIVRFWVGNRLDEEYTGQGIGPEAIRAFSFPGALVLSRARQSEYFWDFVAWIPQAGSSPAASVTSISISPKTATVQPAQTQQFTTAAHMSDGSTSAANVGYTATGGTITSAGLYTAGSAAGTYQVVATQTDGTLADTATVTITAATPAPVASVTVSGATSIMVGQTTQLTATTRDSSNNVVTGRTIAWSSSNTSVATVSTTGMVTGVTGGSAVITATSEGKSGTLTMTVSAPPPPPPPNGIADPTLLVRATGQHPVAGTYGRALAAGQTYVDPNTNVTVLKLTDASTPTANSGMYHGYSEGGPTISQPWTGSDGQTYYTAAVGTWLVDINYATLKTTNWRRVSYWGELGLAFSLDPSTPRIAYIGNSTRVDRYNTATNQIENTGNWPWMISGGQYLDWLQVNLNDQWVVGMFDSNHTVVAFRPSDGAQRAITEADAGPIDEPHLDREFPYIYLSTNSTIQNKVVNLLTGTYTNPTDPNGVNDDAHAAPLRGRVVAVSWKASGIISVDTAGMLTVPIKPSPTDWSGDWHMAAQWVFNNPNTYWVVDQWKRAGAYAIYQGMIGFVSYTNDVRLLAAHDAIGGDYGTGGQPHPTLAPDGKFVMWTSNMNGSGRYDTFIARVPTR